jgi:hypothetical protein
MAIAKPPATIAPPCEQRTLAGEVEPALGLRAALSGGLSEPHRGCGSRCSSRTYILADFGLKANRYHPICHGSPSSLHISRQPSTV